METDYHRYSPPFLHYANIGSLVSTRRQPMFTLTLKAVANSDELRELRLDADDLLHSARSGIYISSERTEGVHQSRDEEAFHLGRLAIQRGLTQRDILSMGRGRHDPDTERMATFAETAVRTGISLAELQATMRTMASIGQDWPSVDTSRIIEAGTWDLDALNRLQVEKKKPILAIGPRKLLIP